jgi:O-antigen/teichoic acid export membrane protein
MKKKHGLLRSAAIYTVANVINVSIPFMLLPILTRVLSPSDYGTVAMFGVAVSVLGIFTGLSVQGVIGIRYFERDKVDMPRFIASCLAILVASTAAVLFVATVFHQWLEEFTKLPREWLIIGVLVSAAQIVIQIRLILWQSARQPWKYAALQIGQSALNAGLSLWLVLGFGMAWQGRLIGNSVAVLTFSLLAFWGLWNAGWIKFPASRAYVRDSLKFGVPLVPHLIGMMSISMADRFTITYFLGVSQTGIYMVGLQVGMVLELLASSFNAAFAPWLYGKLKNIDTQSKITIVRYTYLYFLIIIVIAITIAFMAPFLLSFMVGEKFRQAANIVIYVAIGSAFKGMYYMVTNYVFYKSKTNYLALNTFSCGMLSVLLSYFLVKNYGIAGAAIGFMTSQVLVFIGTWFIAQRVYPMPWISAVISPRV